MHSFTLRARYLMPIDRPPIAGGVVSIEKGRIAAIGDSASAGGTDGPVIDLGDVALMPGLVNCHTHLEFSDLTEPLGSPGMSLPDWIRLVLAERQTRRSPPNEVIAAGLAESIRQGTTTIGEIATDALVLEPFRAAPCESMIFRELIGLTPGRVAERLDVADEFLGRENRGNSDEPLHFGLSPHAPYTAHRDLVAGAARRGIVAMHLAESPEEVELLATGRGPLADLLAERGVWNPEAFPSGSRALDYLRILAEAPRSLAIHGNYLDDEELSFLASRRATMSLVYCPRTQARFGHAPYPLARAMSLGVRVAVGTDSRASNPDLSLLAELRAIAAQYPAIAPTTILELGTARGAEALGRDATAGTLTPGKWANLIAIPISAGPIEPAEQILASPAGPNRVWFRGEAVA